jgi:hypothetical protein
MRRLTHTRLKVTWQKHQLHTQVCAISGRDRGQMIHHWKLLKLKIPTQQTTHHFDFRVVTILRKVAQKLRRRAWTEEECMNFFHQLAFHLPTWPLQFILIPHWSRIVPSINTLYELLKTPFLCLWIDNHIWFSCSRATECLAHSCSALFFKDLWRDILSRSLRGFGASLPVAWSQPTFVRYKAFIHRL